MQNPSPIQRGLFVGAIGFLLISVLFSVNGFPASQLFSVLGGVLSLGFYVVFVRKSEQKRRSDYARHVTFLVLVIAIILKSFAISAGSYVFLAAFMAFLVWFAWSVLEQLPSASDD